MQRYVLFLNPPKERGENNDYLIIGAVLHKVKTLEKAQAADGGSYGPPCMQLFLRGCGLCDYRGQGDRACALSYVISPLQGYDIL